MIILLSNGPTLDLYRDFIEEQKDSIPDIVVSCQYPFKIPDSLIKSHTCVNIHYGRLPQYAGCNPIYWQLLLDDQIGVTLHYVTPQWDAGDIIDTDVFPSHGLTADQAYQELAKAGLGLLKKHFKGILSGTAPCKPQDLSKRQYFNKTDINFKYAKHIDSLDDKRIRALHFEGKQYPIINVKGVDYELRRVK